MSENITTTLDDGVLRIVFDRPDARNALTKKLYAELRDVYRSAYLDDSVAVVVLEGTQGNFAVGGDLKEMLGSLNDRSLDIFGYDEAVPFEAIRSLPKPTIAAIDGLCLGGGLTIALCCDIAIATERSKFGMPEARVGVVDGHMPRLLRDRVPPAILRYWLYSGVTFSAADAFTGGLLTKVVPDGGLETAVGEVLGELAKASPIAIRNYKKILNETRPLSSMEDAYETMLGPDALERINRFAQRSSKK
ncbi:enoyl-CoA hydratase/isomerase family protein [Microbacterium immunditiarum]|uniref:Enoyl-CoA hydratase/carnithine racemase n=1 Tax=Microbacterium immunditiarum TaxID=337480 RepID=A0A7Y9GLQ4_9MICO|nr:enoyl-CoA hydratase/isomerase family protein [Microbacterium immunditiarum]NYE18810.1 enoyl-CoA hydratase/carnithine racemase [Microbacterium immunditiarum]